MKAATETERASAAVLSTWMVISSTTLPALAVTVTMSELVPKARASRCSSTCRTAGVKAATSPATTTWNLRAMIWTGRLGGRPAQHCTASAHAQKVGCSLQSPSQSQYIGSPGQSTLTSPSGDGDGDGSGDGSGSGEGEGSGSMSRHSANSPGPQWQRASASHACGLVIWPDSQKGSFAAPSAKHWHGEGEGEASGDGSGELIVACSERRVAEDADRARGSPVVSLRASGALASPNTLSIMKLACVAKSMYGAVAYDRLPFACRTPLEDALNLKLISRPSSSMLA